MYTLDELKEIIRMIDQSSIQEFEMERDNTKLSIKKGGRSEVTAQTVSAEAGNTAPSSIHTAEPTGKPGQAAPESAENGEDDDESLHKITSPMVGTFYQAPSPDADPFVKEGDSVRPDTVVCIVEAMKLMNEIEAEVQGTIVKILVENGQLVEYGQPLFLVKPE